MFDSSRDCALKLDAQDPLAALRDQFWIPRNNDNSDVVYFVGNSLGLQPRRTTECVLAELGKWQSIAVRGHFEGDFPWMPYHEFLTSGMAKLVGGQENEVVTMNSLTVNLHLMMETFYRPTAICNKILLEEHAFPSDHYAVHSQLHKHGFDISDAMVIVPEEANHLLCHDRIEQLIDQHADSLALVLLPGVQYYTGQVLDMSRITERCHRHGINIGFDLAHAAGNIPLQMHDWDVDFAVWCTYKYLNSGPGSVGGCFVHERHATNCDLPRLGGWWGHDKESRFRMENEFQPMKTAEGWQLSNPPILSLAAIRASLDVFEEAGGITRLREKSIQLTNYFYWLLKDRLSDRVRIITPGDESSRGCQLSIEIVQPGVDGKQVHFDLEQRGVMTDWREPNVIRAAPVPLYNRFEEVFHFVDILGQLLK